MSLERLNNLPLIAVQPNLVAIFVFFGTAASFINKICSLVTEAKREAILFFSVCSEVILLCYYLQDSQYSFVWYKLTSISITELVD